jgi:transposase
MLETVLTKKAERRNLCKLAYAISRKGVSIRTIAARTGISESTIRRYVKNGERETRHSNRLEDQ